MEHNHMLPRPANHSASAGRDQKHDLYGQERRQIPSSDVAAAFQALDPPFKLPLYPPPPSYAQTHQDHKSPLPAFPDVPKTELAPLKFMNSSQHDKKKKKKTLPSLSSLTVSSPKSMYTSPPSQPQTQPSFPPAPTYAPPPPPARPQPTHWPSLNPLTAYYTPSHAEEVEPLRMEEDSSSNSVASAASPDQFDHGRSSSVSLDDPDVRLAAEALGDLRADFVSSPQNRNSPLSSTPRPRSRAPPEPLLQLLTTNHPILGNVIEGTQSAYVASKNYSPRFRSSAEYVEGYVTPVARTVGSVGRVTGVEGGVRWFLGGGKRHKSQSSADLESGSNKRRKADDGSDATMEDMDEPMSGAETPRPTYDPNDRRLSIASTIDTLPAYDEYRSPAYEATESRPGSSSAWQSRLILSTSGLSIAMSHESLRSLKYCLSWLRWANVHIGNVINSLKLALDRYDKTSMDGSSSSADVGDRQQIAFRITALRADVLKTLSDVISTVSKYAGGALPENARLLVRRHLTSLPQRFRVAAMAGENQQNRDDQTAEEAGEAKEEEMRESASRVLVLAQEGLDMMSQVSGVLDGTIVSAEEWCERLGKRKEESIIDGPTYPLEDVKMG
ncbi:transcription factor Opi1-domain-containing protein [Xylariales sp. AK1849]|nr:transcription factor Opi1-domain-containing protein [Xylariales sp. AK1849]